MMGNIYLIAFGTFGNPYGFRQTFFKISNNDFAKSLKTFDLNTNAIKLFKNSVLYSIRKENFDGITSISYSIYTYAKEQNSDRGGTFIGSSIIFTNEIPNEISTISKLNGFHEILVKKNVVNDVLSVNHSDDFNVEMPKNFNEIGFNQKKISSLNNTSYSNKTLVVYCDITPNKLAKLFIDSLELLNNYDCIYFTSNNEVATFVHQKGIFELVKDVDEFTLKIKSLKEEKLKKFQLHVNELENEKLRLLEDKKKLIEEYKKEMDINQNIHKENEKKLIDSKQKIILIDKRYNQYYDKINESIISLKSNTKYEDVKRKLNEQKREFISNVDNDLKPVILNSFNNSQKNNYNRSTSFDDSRKPDAKYEKNDYYLRIIKKKNILIKLLILLIIVSSSVTMACLLYSENYFSDEEEVENNDNSNFNNNYSSEEVLMNDKVNPNPNDQLSKIDYEIIAENIKIKMTVDQIVKIIFEKNPSDVKKYYEFQVKSYSKLIMEKNPFCFKERNGDFYFIGDTLRVIPSYKSN